MGTWIGVGASVFFGVLAIIFYVRGKREKKPQVRTRSFNFFNKSVSKFSPHIEITHGGRPVEHLTVTNYAFWNAGKEPIRKEDISPTEPFKIKAENGFEILEAKVIQVSNEKAPLYCNQPFPNYVDIRFQYLEKNEGAVIQILHTGHSDGDLRFEGKIIGASMDFGKQRFVSKFTSWKQYPFVTVAVFMALVSSMSYFAASNNFTGEIVDIGILILCIIFLTYGTWAKDSIQAVPPSLDSFHELE